MFKEIKRTAPDKFDVVVIGGGLAGLTSAIHLSRNKLSVLVIEKNKYPNHKVCGEYVSNEVLPYLMSLDIDPMQFGAKTIKYFELSTIDNKSIKSPLPLGGFGISRYTFDSILADKAKSNGVFITIDSAQEVRFHNDVFTIKTKAGHAYMAIIAIGAYGKRSALDVDLHRRFINKKSPYLAVKFHAQGNYPEDLVALHNFDGGYCGVSKVENDHINLCYITTYKAFKKYKNIDSFQNEVLFKNTRLKAIFAESIPVFKSPLSISQISFAKKSLVENHILMCGDTAGLIHPLCGNGMSMAIRSASIISQLITQYFKKEIKSRELLERRYKRAWNAEFKTRLKIGRLIAGLFEHHKIAGTLLMFLKRFPTILPKIIQLTHGRPMLVK